MAYGARLESGLGAIPQGFKSPILRSKVGNSPFFKRTGNYTHGEKSKSLILRQIQPLTETETAIFVNGQTCVGGPPELMSKPNSTNPIRGV